MKSRFIRCASCLAALLSFAATAGEPGPMKTKPIWELKAPVEITGGAPVEIPHTASLDAGRFTMRFEFELPEVTEGEKGVRKLIKVLSQEIGETGWSIEFYQTAANTCQFTLFVNGHNYGLGFLSLPVKGKPKKMDYYTMTLVSRGEGVVSFYLNPEQWWGKRQHCATAICPNLEPIKIGWAEPERLKAKGCVPMNGIKIRSLAFYGPEEDWYPKGEEKKIPAMTRAGKGWAVTIPGDMSDAKRPKVLCYGDSIFWGYNGLLTKRTEGNAYICGWMDFIEGLVVPEEKKKALAEAAASEKFDWIFFNNGIHFLYWGDKNWTEERIKEHYRDIVRSFRKGAPQAKIVFLATTPQVEIVPKGEKAKKVGKENDRFTRQNRLAAEVAKEMDCGFLDVYTPMTEHLDYARGGGDQYHWTDQGYQIIVDAIVKTVFPNGLKPQQVKKPKKRRVFDVIPRGAAMAGATRCLAESTNGVPPAADLRLDATKGFYFECVCPKEVTDIRVLNGDFELKLPVVEDATNSYHRYVSWEPSTRTFVTASQKCIRDILHEKRVPEEAASGEFRIVFPKDAAFESYSVWQTAFVPKADGERLAPVEAKDGLPRGAADFGCTKVLFDEHPTTADISPNRHGKYKWYSGLWYASAAPADYFTMTNGVLALEARAGKMWGDLVSCPTHISEVPNAQIPLLDGSRAFYVEFESRQTDNDPDHFAAQWLMPTDKLNGTEPCHPEDVSPRLQKIERWMELDVDEANFGPGITGTVHNWWGYGWPNHHHLQNANNVHRRKLDRTKWNRFGVGYDPVSLTVRWYLNDEPMMTARYPYVPTIARTEKFFLIMGPQWFGKRVPYQLFVKRVRAYVGK